MDKYDEDLFDDDSDQEVIVSKENDFGEITSFAVTHNVRTIKSMIDDKMIDIDPDFQRGFIWDIKRASKLIDSLLSNLPIPSLLFAKRKIDEGFIVVDGKQRLSAIYYFLEGIFPEGEKKIQFKLKGLEGKSWNGKTFFELDELSKRKIFNSLINTTILTNVENNPRIIFEIFNRLNTGGVPLTNQEIRNGIFKGPFNIILKELNNFQPWKEMVSRFISSKRLNDVELILRFFSLYNGKYLNYNAPMREWINDSMDKNKLGSTDVNLFKDIFKETLTIFETYFPKDVFKGGRRNFNRALLDAMLVAISEGILNKNLNDNLLEKYYSLIELDEFWENSSTGTTDPKKVKRRIELAKEYFLKNE